MHRRLFRLLLLLLLLLPLPAALSADPATGRSTPPDAGISATGLYYLPLVRVTQDSPLFDMAPFMASGDVLYEVQHSIGSQARHQTQYAGATFFHTKGNEVHAEWEELWYTADTIYRGTDTSPGNEQYYTLRDPGQYGSAWAPRYWRVGDLFERNPLVTFYRKSDCGVVLNGTQRSWLRFEAYYPSRTFQSGITLTEVVELAWLLSPQGEPIERYFYAAGYGLVGWTSSSAGYSYVSEIHAPGARPDNSRESLPCLDTSAAPQQLNVAPLPYWPGAHRR